MSLYVMDTDFLTLYRRNHPAVVRQVYAHFLGDLAVAVISAEELMTGWLTYIRSYTEQAITRYEHLRSPQLNVASQDLRIAAIALETNATVVTRNLRDFQRVPGLRAEDWAA